VWAPCQLATLRAIPLASRIHIPNPAGFEVCASRQAKLTLTDRMGTGNSARRIPALRIDLTRISGFGTKGSGMMLC